MSQPRPENWKALGNLNGYLKGKETKLITAINPKVIKAILLCDSNYDTNTETRNGIIGLIPILG